MKSVFVKYKNLQTFHYLMSIPLSLTAISVMYLLISFVGYSIYGIAIFGYSWNENPTFWQKLWALISHTFTWKYCFFVIIGFIADTNCWPYFYKLKTPKIDFTGQESSRSSEQGSDRGSEF